MAKALKMASVGPVMVTILSGQFPSEMLILAPLYREVSTRTQGSGSQGQCPAGSRSDNEDAGPSGGP